MAEWFLFNFWLTQFQLKIGSQNAARRPMGSMVTTEHSNNINSNNSRSALGDEGSAGFGGMVSLEKSR